MESLIAFLMPLWILAGVLALTAISVVAIFMVAGSALVVVVEIYDLWKESRRK